MEKSNKWRDLLLKNRGGRELLPVPLPQLQNVYNSITQDGNVSPLLTSPLNKLWRARIIMNRATSPMEKHHDTKIIEKVITTRENRLKRDNQLSKVINTPDKLNYSRAPETKRSITNHVIIINPHTKPITKLILQAFSNIEVTPESTWAVVKSMGRNNPFYMFTGSEDTLSLEISWYSMDDNREDVINKCRLLESWTKSDGYTSSPPTLWISWGNSGMFEGDSFILKSAPYKPSNFQNSYRKGERKSTNEIIDLKLFPNSATQTLTFNRVTSDNRKHEDIIPNSKLKTTRGVIL